MHRPDSFDLVGTTVAGKYAVEAVVDEGGFSIIYRARHVLLNRHVALKAFKAAHTLSDGARDELLRAFVQEGALLGDLSERCAAICQARDVATLITARGEWVPYIVLEWLDGECLEDVLLRERLSGLAPRTLAQAMGLLAPIADALAIAHDKKVTHRDMKPGNVFVLADRDARCRVKLLDFGIAKIAHEAAKTTGSLARSFTPSYGAPEQFSPELGPTGAWTDVYAFALVLVELLTAREPYDSDDIELQGAQAIDPDVRPTPRTRGAVVSDEVEAVFARALAVEPRRRYANARDFWRALEKAAWAHAPRRAHDRSPDKPRVAIMGAVIALVGLALGLATGFPNNGRGPQAKPPIAAVVAPARKAARATKPPIVAATAGTAAASPTVAPLHRPR